MLVNRLRKNQRSIGKWARQQNLQCYRLYDADLPEYAFAIDCYGRFVHMQEYQPPASIDEAKVSLRREQARAAVQQALNISSDLIVMKTRQRQRGKQQYQALNEYRDKHRQDFVVLEGEARFLVNLHDYLDTGLFLDHRPMRRFIYENARNKRFLICFVTPLPPAFTPPWVAQPQASASIFPILTWIGRGKIIVLTASAGNSTGSSERIAWPT